MLRVAVLVDTSTSWGRRLVTGVHRYVRRQGPWQLFVEARGMEERIRVPRGWRGDGIIARIGSAAMARDLARLRLPVVNVSGIQLPGAVRFPCVTNDLEAGARLAARHFLERGFRNFGYFSLLGLPYVATQQAAFAAAVRAAGGVCATHGVKAHIGAEPDWNLDMRQLAAWLHGLPKPVAILTWNADSGRQVIHACQQAGLQVPEDVALLSGSDDDLLCEISHIPISALHVAAEQIGQRAAAQLDRIMRGGTVPDEPVLIPPLGIVARQSTDTLAIADRALARAVGFIRQHATGPLRVGDVARHAGISRRMLERRFADVLNRTPAGEIRLVRLERAKEMLAKTDLPIPEVAEAAGFGSPEYLAYQLKRATGLSPLRYRRSA